MRLIGTQPYSEAYYDQLLHLMKMVSVKPEDPKNLRTVRHQPNK